MDFINRVIAVFGEWRKGSVFNGLITWPAWFNGCLHKRILEANI